MNPDKQAIKALLTEFFWLAFTDPPFGDVVAIRNLPHGREVLGGFIVGLTSITDLHARLQDCCRIDVADRTIVILQEETELFAPFRVPDLGDSVWLAKLSQLQRLIEELTSNGASPSSESSS